MADRVFLHVRTPKSGTTYLQGMLWENRERLGELGVFLPMTDRRDHNQAAGDLTGNIARALPGHTKATWDDLVADIQAHDGTAVVSEEMLASLVEPGMQRIVESLGHSKLV